LGQDIRNIVKTSVMNLELLTGLRQIERLSDDQVKELIDILHDKMESYKWMDDSRASIILENGLDGKYGEFFGLNKLTISNWCEKYYQNNIHTLIREVQPNFIQNEKTQDEIDEIMKIDKENFISRWENAKEGAIAPLFDWNPFNYSKLVDRGILVESKYKFDRDNVSKAMRMQDRFVPESKILSIQREVIWSQFIDDCIEKGIDLPEITYS